ncbi:MAG: DUF1631 family protein, partial [Rubrivivax sp.]
MSPIGSARALALMARKTYLETLLRGASGLVHACADGAKMLASQTAEPALYMRRRDLVLDMPVRLEPWQRSLEQRIQSALTAVRLARPLDTKPAGQLGGGLTLVEDSAVEQDLMASRLGQTIADRAGWEYTDLCSRLNALEATAAAIDPGGDVLRPQFLARWLIESWTEAGLGTAHWMTLQTVIHDEATHLAQEGYHDANHVLLEQGVKPDIDLRPFIRRAKDTGVGPSVKRDASGALSSGPGGGMATRPGAARGGPASAPMVHSGMGGALHTGNSGLQPMGGAHEETRLMTQTPGLHRGGVPAQAVLGKLNQFVAHKVPGFAPTQVQGGRHRHRGGRRAALHLRWRKPGHLVRHELVQLAQHGLRRHTPSV